MTENENNYGKEHKMDYQTVKTECEQIKKIYGEEKKMKVLSLFDGISGGRLAFERAGIPVEKYYASEIDKYAIQVAQKNFPDIIQIGDVTKLNFADYKDVDIIIGGSPCQDLSIAKQNREGLNGERSRLFWDYVKALSTIKPRYFLLENVASMKKEDRDAITNVLKAIYPETECIMINSALLSAQQRKRYYWTNWHNEQPQDKGILLKDVLESGQIYDKREKSLCLDANYFKGSDLKHNLEHFARQLVAEPVPCALRSWPRIKKDGIERFKRLETKTDGKANSITSVQQDSMVCEPIRLGTLPNKGKGQANRIYSVRGKSVCLNALGGGGGAKTGLYQVNLPDGDYIIRKLTPIECERLQTLPDGYTSGISNTQRYKAIGNGWTVDVIAYILGELK